MLKIGFIQFNFDLLNWKEFYTTVQYWCLVAMHICRASWRDLTPRGAPSTCIMFEASGFPQLMQGKAGQVRW